MAMHPADTLAQCSGKVGFDSYSLARRIQRKSRWGNKNKWVARDLYKCDACGKWHFGRNSSQK